jgi:hypothetical protein
MKWKRTVKPLIVLVLVFIANLVHPVTTTTRRVMYQRDTYYIITNVDGKTLAIPDTYRYRIYDTNGFAIKSEITRVKDGVTNSKIDDNIKLQFLSGHVIEWDETNGLRDTITEYDQYGNPLAWSSVQTDGTISEQKKYNVREEKDLRYQIETECCSGKNSMFIYRNNHPVLEVVDNYRYGQPLYKYFYYFNKKLAAIRAVMKFGPKEETMFHVVYEYDAQGRLVKEEQQNYHSSVNRVTGLYSYDDFGHLTRFEQYTDEQLTDLHSVQYVYWQ